MKLKKVATLLFTIIISCHLSFAQQFNFLHYDIEDGLVQSQVNEMGQDLSGRLWVATIGGLSYFDGNNFTNFTKADGLNSSITLSLLNKDYHKTYIAGPSGLSILSDQKIYHFKSPKKLNSAVHHLVLDEKKTLWGINDRNLFKLSDNKISLQFITGNKEIITAFSSNSKKELVAYVTDKGLFIRKQGHWIPLGKINENHYPVFKIIEYKNSGNEFLLLTAEKIYLLKNNKIQDFNLPGIERVIKPYRDFLQDAKGNLWIAANIGVYRFGETGLIHFTKKEGFTNNAINKIFMDSDQQLWFGTDGVGIFKFGGDTFRSFLKESETINPVIYRISRDENGNIYFVSDLKLYVYDGLKISKVKTPNNIPINFIYSDPSHHLWIHSVLNGIYELINGQLKQTIKMTSNDMPYYIYSMLKSTENKFYVGSAKGCYYLNQEKKLQQIKDAKGFTTSLTQIGKDSVLANSKTGVYMINNYKKHQTFRIKELQNKEVMCVLSQNNLVWFGTLNEGLYLWNKQTNKVKAFTQKNSLSSNDIYSLSLDKNGILWVGTGRGINQFNIDLVKEEISSNQSFNFPNLVVEANQNAVLNTGDTMWIGTTKGLFSYITIPDKNKTSPPNVEIQSVRIFTTTNTGQQDSLKILSRYPNEKILLKSNQNKLIINFEGIHLSNPEKLLYQYKLSGIDKDFSSPLKLNQVIYSFLSPGEYVFSVFAINGLGQRSTIKKLSIEIIPSFYQTIWFKIFILILSIAFIIIAQYFFTQLKVHSKRKIERLRIIEQDKIRVQTVEDFHDDIGNKLTRIAILSDILESKLTHADAAQKNILDQIKQNVSTLYSGTKDILWALDPQSDNLYEIINYLKGFGIDLLNETSIEFKVEGLNDELRKIILPMQYSRNITLMVKELINNAVKHANCSLINLKIERLNEVLRVSIIDNGIGFSYIENSNGRGLINLKSRSKRISAQLDIISNKEIGTNVSLTFKSHPN